MIDKNRWCDDPINKADMGVLLPPWMIY